MIIRENEREKAAVGVEMRGQRNGMVPIELLGGTGRLFATITLPPQGEVAEHAHHGEFEVYCLLQGAGSYNDNGVTVPVAAGDVTYCPDGEKHGLKNTGDTDLVFVAFIGTPQ